MKDRGGCRIKVGTIEVKKKKFQQNEGSRWMQNKSWTIEVKIKKKYLAAVGFEPTPPKRLVP